MDGKTFSVKTFQEAESSSSSTQGQGLSASQGSDISEITMGTAGGASEKSNMYGEAYEKGPTVFQQENPMNQMRRRKQHRGDDGPLTSPNLRTAIGTNEFVATHTGYIGIIKHTSWNTHRFAHRHITAFLFFLLG